MFLSASPPGEPPAPDVAFAWGSRSTRRVAFSITAREAARLTAVVVFPTPPFWLATAMTWTKPLCSHARQTRVIFQKINGLFYHAGACGRNENLVAVPCPPPLPGPPIARKRPPGTRYGRRSGTISSAGRVARVTMCSNRPSASGFRASSLPWTPSAVGREGVRRAGDRTALFFAEDSRRTTLDLGRATARGIPG